jgi:beta-N-acetylhexosaminidase
MKSSLKLILFSLVIVFVIELVCPQPFVHADTIYAQTTLEKAQRVLSEMSPEERVGQLFLVTFNGNQVTPTQPIYQLINDYHIGGVVLKAENDNFVGPTDTLTSATQLIADLQMDNANLPDLESDEVLAENNVYIPLLIGLSQEGNGFPYDQILNELPVLPNLMSIGATWNPDMAFQVGKVMGDSLQSLGVNLILGPSLDVLDSPRMDVGDDLGSRTFGGDPYWVGQMGQSYISGLYEGSQNQLAVVAKHFPGRGGTDRSLSEEVPTVQKSLEQLKLVELAPFFSVTGVPSPSAIDGLLVSHIRYKGFQGNIRATTRPMSFDAAAMEQIMALPEFNAWRQTGGILISDDLGSEAVRKFYDPTGQNFDARQVARNAFLAGNDLLYVDDFVATGDEDSFTTIKATIDFFVQKYLEDPAFAQRVDNSVLNLLSLKFKIYASFEYAKINASIDGDIEAAAATQINFEVAQKAATLIYPDPVALNDQLPENPSNRERIVFFTDSKLFKQCSTCIDQYDIDIDAIQKAVIRLYGPGSSGLVNNYNLKSYSFNDLMNMLNGFVGDEYPPVATDIRSAEWLVFAVQDIAASRPESMALVQFLSDRPDLLRDKKIVVFALDAPYYLDATDISKLTAYYGVFGKTPAFVDAIARILFKELTPLGASPVSIPGVGYSLIEATSPSPNQIIPLYIESPSLAEGEEIPEVEELLSELRFAVGDILPLITGVIYDRNRNPVPDGTVVRFSFISGGEGGNVQSIETITSGGVARLSYQIQNPGLMEIRISSELAVNSEILQMDIVEGEGGSVVKVSATPEPTPTFTPEPVQETLEPVETPFPEDTGEYQASFRDWVFAMMLIWGGAALIYFSGRQIVSARWSLRWSLLGIISGVVFYLSTIMGFPGTANIVEKFSTIGVLLMTLIGVVFGGGIGWLWSRAQK